MSSLAITLLLITGLFCLLLAIKKLLSNLKYCAICLAVSITWLILLVLLWVGVFDDQILVAILLGQSSLGVYYLLEKHAPKALLIFRLPVLVSLVIIAYGLMSRELYIDALSITAGIWLTFSLLYIYRTNTSIRNKAKALIDCCSDW